MNLRFHCHLLRQIFRWCLLLFVLASFISSREERTFR